MTRSLPLRIVIAGFRACRRWCRSNHELNLQIALTLAGFGIAYCTNGAALGTSFPKAETPPAKALRVYDLEGKSVNPFALGHSPAMVLLFISVDCPICNRYAPEIERLYENYGPKGVRFWLVHSDPGESSAAITQHIKRYRLKCAVLRDPEQVLASRAGARVTPEAAVFNAAGKLLYQGRIDNRYVDFGEERALATEHDLAAALDAILGGKPVTNAHTRAVGCYIPGLQ